MDQKPISRRDFLKGAALAAGGVLVPPRVGSLNSLGTAVVPAGFRISGEEVSGLESFDQCMINYMTPRNIPCGALAVARNGKLVFARGYNYNHPEIPDVQPTSLFRTASVTKTFTGTAVMRLVQEQKLSLSDRLVDILDLEPIPGKTPDPRLGEITLLNLLQHQGGWDRGIVPDPMFLDKTISKALGNKPYPITQEDIMAYVTGQPLQHDPGTVYAYSNYGYLLLGKIIEQVTGMDYPDYVGEKIFKKLGITRMVEGRSLLADRFPTEVPYFSIYSGSAVFPNITGKVSATDGTFNLENMEAHGAWLSSPVDLVRFGTAFDNPAHCPLLGEEYIETMLARPANGFAGSAWWYGCGWVVRDKSAAGGPGARNVWHDGSLPGTIAYLVRRWDGLDWAVLVDQRDDPKDRYASSYSAIDGALHVAANAVTHWPDAGYDQFPQYFSGS